MFLQRRTYTILIAMEFQQALRQCTVVQSGSFQQVGHHCLIVLFFHERIDGLAGIVQASSVQVVEKSEAMDVVEKLLLEVRSRHIIVGSQELEHILEHTAGSARCRHELHHLLVTVLVSVPCSQISSLLVSCRDENTAIVHCSGTSQLQEGETLFKTCQLFLDLLLRNTFFRQQLFVFLC